MTTRQVLEQIEEAKSLKMITEAFTEISSAKLKKIRVAGLRNQYFFDELSRVYGLIRKIALARGLKPPQKNGKTLSIVLTSNYRFYGRVNNALLGYFLVETSKIQTDRLVIGKTGLEFLNAIHFALSYQNITLKTDFPTHKEIDNLALFAGKYSRVLVYYPKFKSVMLQIPTFRDITQTQQAALLDVASKEGFNKLFMSFNTPESSSFILEPEISVIIKFFDDQIQNLLLEETFLEAELSRTASRLISMDQAQTEADDYLKEQKRNLFLGKRSTINARMVEIFSSLKISRERTNT